MGEKIALGIHACIDWECLWDAEILCNLIRSYGILQREITARETIESERELVIAVLDFMQKGSGGELIPETEQIVETFAKRFSYRTTVGGTAARAAIAISKLGYSSVLQMSCSNSTIRSLLPDLIQGIPAEESKTEQIYPHVSISYPKNVPICVNDIDFVTPRENRVLISRDIESLNLPVSESFADYARDAKVFLLSCFCEILDFEVLKDRMIKCRNLLARIPEKTTVVFEDGCYINKSFRLYVLRQLRPYIGILSMNEDELQDFVEHKINILDPAEVLEAVKYVYHLLHIPTIFIHSSSWALAYGEQPQRYRSTLESGIRMASARFWHGDDFGIKEFTEIKELAPGVRNIEFSRQIEKMCDNICCVPCKNMGFVEHPTVVGLGDFFAGGLLTDLVH